MDHIVDTNILLRWAQHSDPQHQLAVDAVTSLRTKNHRPILAPQNIVEFWNVATRPQSHNGFGLSPAQADTLVQHIESVFPLMPETPAIYAQWRRLVVSAGVSGKQVHDARLAATMPANAVTHLLTFNVADFQRFAGITAVHPASVQSSVYAANLDAGQAV